MPWRGIDGAVERQRQRQLMRSRGCLASAPRRGNHVHARSISPSSRLSLRCRWVFARQRHDAGAECTMR